MTDYTAEGQSTHGSCDTQLFVGLESPEVSDFLTHMIFKGFYHRPVTVLSSRPNLVPRVGV